MLDKHHQVDATAPSSPIEAVGHHLAGAQSTTHDLISELCRKLESVLPHPAPEAKPSTGPHAINPGESPLHGFLIERYESASAHNARLQKLIDSLTL